MLRLLKALPLALALAALSLLFTSCTSSSNAQVRVVNAIPDGPVAGLDVDINGTKVFTAVTFGDVQPTPPAYSSVKGGSAAVQAFVSGQTTNPVVQGTGTLNGGSQYTVLLNGFEANNDPILFITDNNTAPTSGNIEFRIINGSPSTPGSGVDVYIVPPGTNINGVTPQISGLAFGQASSYVTLSFATAGYSLIVTPNGNQTPYINQTYIFGTSSSGAIRTFVVVDNQNGGSVADHPLELDDLN